LFSNVPGIPAEATEALMQSMDSAYRGAKALNPPQVRHFHCDHLGTPIGMTQATGECTGQLVWAARYDAWGKVENEYDPTAIGQTIRFQGQQFDQETGLHYNRFRYYDPAIGRYLSSDPIGLYGGSNIYSYAEENPLTKKDPLGLDIDYANHIVGAGLNHSKIVITPNNQSIYANDPRFQNIDANGKRFATLGAGPNSNFHLESGTNRARDVEEKNAYKKKLDIPCKYKDEDSAINKLFEMSDNYNKNMVWYTLIPHNIFGIPTGYNSNSFISGLGGAAGFDMPSPGNTGANTPGYQNPIPSSRFK
ncbi:RHS repeat domain-containing protein, partial [Sphingomonas sp. NCPPB 2930]